MIRFHDILAGGALAILGTGAAAAQSPYPYAPAYPSTYGVVPQTDADQLAQQLRYLAADPTNLYALINAAGLSLKLGDVDGAAALYTRAEKAAPGNPQVKAGMARLLVQSERPGEALRLFQEAQARGISEMEFWSDRALAYDLIGEQARAQREYRAILRRGPDDETTRRYALSLGISGMKDQALALLERLNRRSDRGAWRARAFVLAMTGDRTGADRIATTMMPPGMAEGLRPFFDRLPRLGPVDRAFAVHFGQVRGSAARVADARRAPFLPALSPEPDPFAPARSAAVQVAAADTGKKGRKSRKDRKQQAAAQVAALRQPYVAPLPPPPAPTATQLASLGSTRLPPPVDAYGLTARADRGVTVLPPPASAFRPQATQPAPSVAQVAANAVPPVVTRTPLAEDDEPDVTETVPTASRPAPRAAAGPAPTRPAPSAGSPSTALASSTFSLPPAVAPALTPTPVTAATPTAPPPAAASAAAPATGETPTTPAAALSAIPAVTAVAAAPTATVPAAQTTIGAPPPPSGASGDTVLAAIIAGIQVPQSELNAPAPVVVPAQLSPATGRRTLLTNVERKAEIAEKAAAKEAPLRKDARGRYLDAKGRPLLDARGRPLDAKAAAAKLAAADDADPALRKDARGRFLDAKGRPLLDARGRPLDAKAAAAKLAGADNADPALRKDARGRFLDAKGRPLLDARGRPLDAKAATAKLAADAKKPDTTAKAEPARFWVQVAGGANEDTLAKEWARVQGQAAALKGRQGWTTPLRATNRVLTGPFKTDDEAMALVNTLKKQGVSAFMFTSDAGQKITRLGTK